MSVDDVDPIWIYDVGRFGENNFDPISTDSTTSWYDTDVRVFSYLRVARALAHDLAFVALGAAGRPGPLVAAALRS